MNHKALIEFLVENHLLSSKSGKKVGEILARIFNLKQPVLAPVRVKPQPSRIPTKNS